MGQLKGDPQTNSAYVIKLELLAAKNLIGANLNGMSDPYAIITCGEEKRFRSLGMGRFLEWGAVEGRGFGRRHCGFLRQQGVGVDGYVSECSLSPFISKTVKMVSFKCSLRCMDRSKGSREDF
ncbi:BAG-associated GRAM protein 1 [Vitis vinifera]|uniref:BAG-associated GRAM protein 1 n=1 Tax=Vitis vinifera TaxID=29760 RepID=A0A438DFM2_VITVI|nr:BAG-associated GRAM protein 1 [Vitis vinifera]